MQNSSFAGFKDWEDVPLEQWHMMLQIHNQAVERQNAEIEAAKAKGRTKRR